MVFRGRASRGCECCRNSRVRCDERRPSCSRCLRLGRSCYGYRNLDSLMVCDETEKTKTRNNPAKARSSLERMSLVVDLGVGCSMEDMVVWQFYHTTMTSLSKVDHTYHLHSELPKIYTRSPTCSALRLSTHAVAFAIASKSCPSRTTDARKSYTQAVSALNSALQNSHEAIADETLYAVLLLCGYETIICGSERPAGWTAHVSGAAAMLLYRSQQSLTQLFASRLYHFARRSIVLYHIQTCTPIDPMFCGLGVGEPPDQDDADKLFTLMARLSEIQHISKSLTYGQITVHESSLYSLCDGAQTLEDHLRDWATNLPHTWTFNEATDLHNCDWNGPEIEYAPKTIHKYPDSYVARIWNLNRVSRIILYSIILRARAIFHDPSFPGSLDIEKDTLEAKILELVNEICASVPFLLGEDLSKMRSAESDPLYDNLANYGQVNTNIKQASQQNGAFSLLWPLYTISSVPFIPDAQRRWIRKQLLAIGEAGEPLGIRLAESQSQTLAGGAEAFAFDCV